MWQNDRQACRAIRVLLASLFHDIDSVWTLEGPTDLAVAWLASSPLSHGEKVMLQIAFDFWGGFGKAQFADIIGVLDGRRSRDVFELARAYSVGAAVEEWIAKKAKDAEAEVMTARIAELEAMIAQWRPLIDAARREHKAQLELIAVLGSSSEPGARETLNRVSLERAIEAKRSAEPK